MSVDPLRFVTLGAAIVVDNQVERGGILHGKRRATDLLSGSLVLGPFLNTVDKGFEYNAVATIAVGIVESSAEGKSVIFLVKRIDEV